MGFSYPGNVIGIKTAFPQNAPEKNTLVSSSPRVPTACGATCLVPLFVYIQKLGSHYQSVKTWLQKTPCSHVLIHFRYKISSLTLKCGEDWVK